MNKLLRLFKTTNLNQVFTPNTVAQLTYINRDIIETDLEKYLSLPGKQIVIYGHSGSGKTTLLRNKLKLLEQNYIKTHCESKTTFNDLILQAFDELNGYYVAEKNSNSQYAVSEELKAEYVGIGSKINETHTVSQGEKLSRIVPLQLTPQKLAQFLGEINCLWIIEDFHKVVDVEKQRIADVIKIFIDSANDFNKVKIVCIGAVGTARELIELDNNLNNRIAELFVPLLTNDEIESIIIKGFDLLNINIDDDLKDKIIYYSNNLASITHQICYDLCFHSGIKDAKFFPKKLKSESFRVAVNSYVRKNSDTFSKIYDTIICQGYGWHVLKTFESLEKETLTIEEIKTNIPPTKRPKNDEEIISYLEQLGSAEYKEIIRYDKSSLKYSLSSPFFRAFLKMKFALEKSEETEVNNKRKNKRIDKYSIDANGTRETRLLIDEEFYISYYQVLEEILASKIKINSNITAKKKKR
jgi:energy-coupling factor transporter ATP-binding protein EcfA2